MNTLEYQLSYSRHLPHIQPPGATLFVTFRLAGSIPLAVQRALLAEAAASEKRLSQIGNTAERQRLTYEEHKRLFGRWDAVLDRAETGPRWLGEPQIAQLVQESLHYRDGKVYDLDAFCIMSNHVHVLFTPLPESEERYYALPAIMQSLKGFTARQANVLLGRDGQFWQHESYDHIVRNERERQRIRRYILQNPVKAGLVRSWDEWPWSFVKLIS